MTGLLISVRDAAEAEVALAGGAAIIDVKEPSRGPLGAADLVTIRDVVSHIAGRAVTSAALGDLFENRRLDADLAGSVRYAKFGLAGAATRADWIDAWRAAVEALPAGVIPVAVAYADWQTARAPDPFEILAHATPLGCGAALVDTFDKAAGPLSAHLAPLDLARWIDRSRAQRLTSVVAGGLTTEELPDILALRPDYVGVRGAACTGGRAGRIDLGRVRRLSRLVRGPRYVSHR